MSYDACTIAIGVIMESVVSVRVCVAVVLNSSKRVTVGNDLNRGCTALLSGIAFAEEVFHDL